MIVRLSDFGLSSDFRTRLVLIQNRKSKIQNSLVRPRRVSGDKGYSSRKIRLYLRRRGIRYTIARKTNEHRGGKFDKALYRMRNLVERCFNRLKQYRAPILRGFCPKILL